MGGRLHDWIASGLYASRPSAASALANTHPSGTSLYFSSDTGDILSVLDASGPAWIEINMSSLTGAFASLSDVDWSTPPTDGQIFEWDTTSSKLIPVAKPTDWTTEQLQDLVGAMLGAVVGLVATYDDPTGTLQWAISEASDAECWAATASNRVITPKKIADMSAFVTVNDVAGTLTIDGDLGFNFKTTLDTATTFSFTNMFDGQTGTIEITQDGTGGRVATWDTDQRFPGGGAANGVLSTGANKVDILTYVVRGTLIHCSLMKDMIA